GCSSPAGDIISKNHKLLDHPLSNTIPQNSPTPTDMTIHPSFYKRICRVLPALPASTADTTCCTATFPVSVSTSTSAAHADRKKNAEPLPFPVRGSNPPVV